MLSYQKDFQCQKSPILILKFLIVSKSLKFDIVFLDPPYKLDCCNEIIFAIENKDLLTPDGLIVCEVDSNTIINETDNFEICKEREYGIRKVYRDKKRPS